MELCALIERWLQLQKNVPNHYHEYSLFSWKVLRKGIWHIFGEMEKLSEIKLHLRSINGKPLVLILLTFGIFLRFEQCASILEFVTGGVELLKAVLHSYAGG